MRRFLILSASLACFSGCTCGKSPPSPSAPQAGLAVSPPPAPKLAAPTPPPPPPIPERAMQLHMEGRKHGAAGEFAQALQSFQQAREVAPNWLLPLYDEGLTYVYMKDDARALEAYEQLNARAPEGFSDGQQMLDSLRREKDGRVPKGTLREFLDILRLRDLPEIRQRLEALTRKAPGFAPAWKELALTSSTPDESERMVAKALTLEPDATSRGELLVFRALVTWRRGEREAARKQLQALVEDPRTAPTAAGRARDLLALPENITP